MTPSGRSTITSGLLLLAASALAWTAPAHAAVNDTLLVRRFDWEDPDGTCRTRDWVAEDLANRVFAHVSDRFVPINGGQQALWFGADSVSAPGEVENWVQRFGYGNHWSQRFVSPPITLQSGDVLEFDAILALGPGHLAASGAKPEFFAVQVESTLYVEDWKFIHGSYFGGPSDSTHATAIAGSASFHGRFGFGASSGNSVSAAPTRLRFVVQTDGRESMADGRVPASSGALVLDNITLTRGASILLSADFEAGSVAPWTLSAMNGAPMDSLAKPLTQPIIRKPSTPETFIQPDSLVDPIDPSCVWTFYGGGVDTIQSGTYARMASPYIAYPDPSQPMALTFEGRFPVRKSGIRMSVGVLLKNVGEPHPHAFFDLYHSGGGAGEGDQDAPWYRFTGTIPNDTITTVQVQADSLRFVFEVADQIEGLGVLPANRVKTRLPVVDRAEFSIGGVDQDGDGVADLYDACPLESAAGQDADGDGCPDPYASMRHVESWRGTHLPVHYSLSARSVPAISPSDSLTIRQAIFSWVGVSGSRLSVVEDPRSQAANASALDGVNLVTFDNEAGLPPGVLALTPTTSFTRATSFGDSVYSPGEIVDSDVLLNPEVTFNVGGGALGFDLASVIAHEAGHLFGLSHSGVTKATMFPVLPAGTAAASLEEDDQAAIASAYPAPELGALFGEIRGRVKRGDGSPVAGALVLAVRTGAPGDTVASDFTDERGVYGLRRLAPGDYSVRVHPLDGSIPGLFPGIVNARVLASASTNFLPEWWSDATESDSDSTDARAPITLIAGAVFDSAVVITNRDVTPPFVRRVAPAPDSTGIGTDTAILVEFSEPVIAESLQTAFKLSVTGDSASFGGRGQLIDDQRFVFVPAQTLAFDTEYELRITTALTDRAGLQMTQDHVTHFHTAPRTAMAVTALEPPALAPGGMLTLIGGGFDPTNPSAHRVVFAGTVEAEPICVLPASIVVRVPEGATSGPVKVTLEGSESTPASFQVLAPAPHVPLQQAGAPVALHAAPTAVAFTPDGRWAFVSTEAGVETVGLDEHSATDYLRATEHQVGRGSTISLRPDGRRAYLLQPDLHRILVLGTLAGEATFGEIITSLPLPDLGAATFSSLALSRDGRLAYLGSTARDSVLVVDVNEASVTRGVLRWIRVPSAGGVRAIATRGFADTLIVAVAGTSVHAISLDTDSSRAFSATVSPIRQLRIAPDDSTLWAIGDTPPEPALAGTSGSLELWPYESLTNTRADGVFSPTGSEAFALGAPASGPLEVADVNSLSRLQTLTLVPGTPVAVGADPTARFVGVAEVLPNQLLLYRHAEAATIGVVAPLAGSPGDIVSLSAADVPFDPGTLITLGPWTATPYSISGTTLAFRIPDLAEPGASSLFATNSGGASTVPAAFRVARRLSVPVARPADREDAGGESITCLPFSDSTYYRAIGDLAISGDGTSLVVGRGGPASGACPLTRSSFELWQATDGGNTPLATRISSATRDSVRALQFSLEGSTLWVLQNATLEAWTRGASPGSMQNLVSRPGPAAGNALTLDPRGRWCFVAWDDGSIARHHAQGMSADSLGLLEDFVSIAPDVADRLAVTRDGRTLVAVTRAPGLSFFDAVTLAPIAAIGTHGAELTAVALTADGKCLVGRDAAGTIGVWNVDPALGAVGTEIFFGSVAPVGSGSIALVAGPDASQVLCGLADRDSVVILGTEVNPPSVRVLAAARTRAGIAITPDRHQLWLALPSGIGVAPDTLVVFDLSPVADLIPSGGSGQVAPPSSTLSTSLRVRLVDSDQHPVVGSIVRFEPIDDQQGALDGGSAGERALHLTDANGEATTSWTLPSGTGSFHVRAFSGGLADTVEFIALSANDSPSASPVILSYGPTTGAIGMDPLTPMFIRFSKPMDSTSVTYLFRASVGAKQSLGGTPVQGRFSLEDGGRLLLFRPDNSLPFEANVFVQLFPGVLDRDLNLLNQGLVDVTNFRIQSTPALSLESVTPRAAPVGAPVVMSGTGFSRLASQNVVLMNGPSGPVTAPVQVVAENGVVFRVPAGALSGDVWVRVGEHEPQSRLQFTVLDRDTGAVAVSDSLAGQGGARDVAVTPDGTRAYVTQPTLNTVLGMRLDHLEVFAAIPVGRSPEAIAILGGVNQRAYAANRAGNDISIIDVTPSDSTMNLYNKVVGTIPVGSEPVAVAVSAIGPRVFVANRGSGTLSIIDARSTSATFHQVVSTVTTGSGTKGVCITPDGTLAIVSTTDGIVIVDLSSRAVVSTVKTGSGTKGVAITPDGTLALVLTDDGDLMVVVLLPGPYQYQVISTATTGSGTKGVSVTPDGGLAVVLRVDGSLMFFRIVGGVLLPDGSQSEDGVALAASDSLGLSSGSEGIAIDPVGGYATVVNPGTGTITRVALPGYFIPAHVRVAAEEFALDDGFNRTPVRIEPQAPFAAGDIDLASIRLPSGILADTLDASVADTDGNGVPELTLHVLRDSLFARLGPGSMMPFSIAGRVAGRTLGGTDSVWIERTPVVSPGEGIAVLPGASYLVEWTKRVPPAPIALLMQSLDDGRTWTKSAQGADSGHLLWTSPMASSDSVRIAVVEADSVQGPLVAFGMAGSSERFRLASVTAVVSGPPSLSILPVNPNPSVGKARLRFGMPRSGIVDLSIFDVSGRRVRRLISGVLDTGWHEAPWGGTSESGERCHAGVFFARLRVGGQARSVRFVLLP